ncbi:alpha/beta fold hydrolase [bacterium]|nr:alpha/beta fold hydrolase [bacterium]
MSSGIDFELLHEVKSQNGILLFHGLTGSPFEMKKYGNFLFKSGYDVYCYSLPGHGERLNEIETVKFQDWCEFAQGKYELLRGRYENFFVSGLCLGAVISLYLAEHNQDLNGVACLSTTLFLDGASMPWYKFLLPIGLHTILRYYYTFPEDNSLGVKNEDTRRKLAKLMAKTTVGLDNYPLSCVYELLKLSKNVRANLDKIKVPILLVHSLNDNLTKAKSAKMVYERVSSEIKKYVEIEDSYHMVLYDNEKERVMREVLDFLTVLSLKTDEMRRIGV